MLRNIMRRMNRDERGITGLETAIILIAFLVSLALGSLLAHRLLRLGRPAAQTLTMLLGVGAILVAISPWLFYALTGGLRYVADRRNAARHRICCHLY